jgi:metal-responsive CopG/Arc/MetJ family transcriptional regulator
MWAIIHTVRTIQIVIEDDLLRATDREARRRRANRSELIREAIRQHLRRLRLQDLEERERKGYRDFPAVEFDVWERVFTWPKD